MLFGRAIVAAAARCAERRAVIKTIISILRVDIRRISSNSCNSLRAGCGDGRSAIGCERSLLLSARQVRVLNGDGTASGVEEPPAAPGGVARSTTIMRRGHATFCSMARGPSPWAPSLALALRRSFASRRPQSSSGMNGLWGSGQRIAESFCERSPIEMPSAQAVWR